MSTPVQIPIHVVDSSSPVFPDQQTEVRIPENMAMHSPVLSIQAVSPKGQKLIYSIFDGDKYGDFAVDFNTGTFLYIFVYINVCADVCLGGRICVYLEWIRVPLYKINYYLLMV